jgi:trk system potassium uptake protein
VVRLFTFRQGDANLVELTLPTESPYAGTQLGDVMWPSDVSLVTVLRDGRVLTPDPQRCLEAGDELLFVSSLENETEIERLLSPHTHHAD